MPNLLDITELPKNYLFNKESLTEGKYIDDNSLFLYQLLAQGRLSVIDSAMNFLYYKPFEWNDEDFVAFLLSISKEYGLEIKGIKTNFSPIQEDYEVALIDKEGQPTKRFADFLEKLKPEEPFEQPKWYDGAYRWILDLKEKGDTREEVQLFDRFFTDTATVADIERLLIYAHRIAPAYKAEDDELWLSKDIFKNILDWTTFFIEVKPEQKIKLDIDIKNYMDAFINEKLQRNNFRRRIAETSVNQSYNIFTFKKHSLLFREYLQKMQDDFGTTVTIENTFEDRFPNYGYTDPEDVRKRYANRNFLFLHTLFAFEKQGLLKILSLGSNWDFHEDEALTYQSKIEILPAFFNEDLSKKLYFDLNKSRFYVQGKEIKLLKFKDEYHTLRVLFEDPKELSKEWFFSEIAEKIDESNLNDKKYYNAIYQLRLKLEKQGINDFFISTRQSVKINKKYLS